MKKLCLVMLLGWLPFAALAVKVSSLYRAELPVTSQLAEDRAQAVTAGLTQVLVKVSGDPLVASNAIVKEAIKKADYYVEEFSYSAPTTSSAQYFIKIRYHSDDINRLLKKAGISYWGETRPLVFVWLVVDGANQEAEIIGNESPGDILSTMKQEGKKFGLPLIFPMMDVGEMNEVMVEDITELRLPLLKSVGQRYAPGAFLIGQVDEVDEQYQSKWVLLINDDKWNWSVNDQSIESVFATVLNQVSQTLAKQHIAKSEHVSQSWLHLEVSHVTERSDLAQLMEYLEQLSLVKQVQLSQVEDDTVELSVLVRGSSAMFQKNVSKGLHLVFKSQDLTNNKLTYEWVR